MPGTHLKLLYGLRKPLRLGPIQGSLSTWDAGQTSCATSIHEGQYWLPDDRAMPIRKKGDGSGAASPDGEQIGQGFCAFDDGRERMQTRRTTSFIATANNKNFGPARHDISILAAP